ncbi:hypothetical protein ACOMHN_005563 [Nucella lapillus]
MEQLVQQLILLFAALSAHTERALRCVGSCFVDGTHFLGMEVIFTQSGPPIVAQRPDPKDKPKDYVNTSCAVLFACNFIFGILGWHYGSKSNNAWQVGDIDEAKRQAKKALIFVIIGIIVGLLTYALAFGLYFGVYVPNNQ